MKFTRISLVLMVSLAMMASENKPSITAQLAPNKESPSETDLVIVIGNKTKEKVSLTLPRYDGERFEILNLIVTTPDGQPVPYSGSSVCSVGRLRARG